MPTRRRAGRPVVQSSAPALPRRQLAAAARERALSERRRRRVARAVGASLVLLLVVVGVGVALSRRGGARSTGPAAVPATAAAAAAQIVPTSPTGAVTRQTAPRRVADTSGIPGVLAWDTTNYPGNGAVSPGSVTHDHVTGPVAYAVLPPVGGPHNATWMNAGTYTEPIAAERAVHNLEHGAVWITYAPDLPAAQVSALRALVDRQSSIDESLTTRIPAQRSRFVDLSPWSGPGLPSPVVISAWGHQLRVTDPADPRLQRFVDVFRNSRTYSPEYGSPVDGVPVDTGGRPAADGASAANPAGSAG